MSRDTSLNTVETESEVVLFDLIPNDLIYKDLISFSMSINYY